MANHVIRDRIWASKKLSRLSLQAALAYPWIFLVADDWGRFEYRPRVIWGQVFGAREDVTAQDVAGWLQEYETQGLLVRFHTDGDLAYWTGFAGRPKSKRRPSMYPDPGPFQGVQIETGESVRTLAGGRPDDECSKTETLLPAVAEQESRAEVETEHVTGAVSLGVPESERPAYADAVWSEFLRVSASKPTRVMAPGEWVVLKGWMDSGVPLMLVLRGIADTRGKGSSLGYYGPSVKAAIELWRKAVA